MSFENFRRLAQQKMKEAKQNGSQAIPKKSIKYISTTQSQPLKATPQKGGCCGKKFES